MLCALHVEVVTAVEVAVADGFHDVVLADGDAAFEVGDGSVRHFNLPALLCFYLPLVSFVRQQACESGNSN